MTTNSKIKLNLDSLKSRREWKRHKVKDGHNIFRILPPFSESSNGYAFRKWQIIWGLADPETGRMRPFASSMTSEKKCPVTEYVAQLTAKADNLRNEMQAQGVAKDEITARLKDFNQLISDLKPKTVYIYNAADKAGEVGLLELKSTAHKKMKTEMAQYVHDYNQDPTSLNSNDDDSGLWFDIVRSGLGRDTEYDVKKCQIKQKDEKGRMSFVDDRSALPDSVVQNYDNLGYDLASVYQVKSYDDLAEILAANMPSLVARCQDANIGDYLLEEAMIAAPETKPKATGAGKINIKLDSADDEDDDAPVVSKPVAKAAAPKPTAKAVVADDDDFLAEADALLNS